MPTFLTSLNLTYEPRSLLEQNGVEYGLAHTPVGMRLAICASSQAPELAAFEGEHFDRGGRVYLFGSLTEKNAAGLRAQLDWLNPSLLDLHTSAGMGDRLGLATPGHIRAVRAAGSHVAPIFAQQSIREMTRTERTPQQVMDDALWGIFTEGWQNGFGADADHLKTTDDIDACLSAGFTFFTIDPSDYVKNVAEDTSVNELRELVELMLEERQPKATGLLKKKMRAERIEVEFDERTLLRNIVKYNGVITHILAMVQHLSKAAGTRPFEVEISLDESEKATTHGEHLFIASELKRLGVRWVSLAPRFVGLFEKGVEYISPLGASAETSALSDDMAGHAMVARLMGPYKLSLHSGSDKFSVYPIAMRETRGLVHLKTAGTSYLEALRLVAELDTDLFEEIYIFACERFDKDKASYNVSANASLAPKLLFVNDWPALLDQFDVRQILHITYGSVMTERDENGRRIFGDRILGLISSNLEKYSYKLEQHMLRHLRPFS
jgi:hypothetical protein